MSTDNDERTTLVPPAGEGVPPPFPAEALTGQRSAVRVSLAPGYEQQRSQAQVPLLEPGLFLRVGKPLDPRLPASLFAVDGSEARSRLGHAMEVPAGLEIPALGTIVDKYRLEEVMGIGAFGVVFRATHLLLKTTVAIKMVRRDVMRERPELAQRLCEEARHAARVGHPNVVRVLDVTHTKEITYFVMEFLEGETLAARVERLGPLTEPDAARLAVDVASGLEAGLAHGIVHRDVKPANVVITRAGPAKVVDLGLAASVDQPPIDATRLERVGTRGYMAPEVVAGRGCDFRSDMYSLGVTLHFALTGQLPRAPGELRARTSSPLVDLVEQLLAVEPRLRPRSYADVIERAASSRKEVVT